MKIVAIHNHWGQWSQLENNDAAMATVPSGDNGTIGDNDATVAIVTDESPLVPFSLLPPLAPLNSKWSSGDCKKSIDIEWIHWFHYNGSNGRQWRSPLAPMQMEHINTSIGANGNWEHHCHQWSHRHWRQWNSHWRQWIVSSIRITIVSTFYEILNFA